MHLSWFVKVSRIPAPGSLEMLNLISYIDSSEWSDKTSMSHEGIPSWARARQAEFAQRHGYRDLQQQDEPYISAKGNGEHYMAVKGNWWALQTMTIGQLSLEMESLHKTKTPELDKMPKGKKGVGQKMGVFEAMLAVSNIYDMDAKQHSCTKSWRLRRAELHATAWGCKKPHKEEPCDRRRSRRTAWDSHPNNGINSLTQS